MMSEAHTNLNEASVASAEELAALRSLLQKFCAENIRPRVRELEDAGEFPKNSVALIWVLKRWRWLQKS
jgi:HPt (histidine-containing phosphotransfer) domain-containing protein